MDTVVVGIFGVVLGGILNALGSYFMAYRRERREVRTAARLLLPELLQAQSDLRSAIESRRWSICDFSTNRWSRYEVALAASLDKKWGHLCSVYTALALLMGDRAWREDDGEHEIDDPDDLEYLHLTYEAAEAGIQILHDCAEIPEGTTLRLPEVYGV